MISSADDKEARVLRHNRSETKLQHMRPPLIRAFLDVHRIGLIYERRDASYALTDRNAKL